MNAIVVNSMKFGSHFLSKGQHGIIFNISRIWWDILHEEWMFLNFVPGPDSIVYPGISKVDSCCKSLRVLTVRCSHFFLSDFWVPKLWLLYRPSSSSPHMLPSSSTKTCWSGCSVSMAQQNVHRKAKMESDEKVGQSLFSLHSRPNKWEKQSKHEVKTLKFYVKDMNMTRQHMATLVLEFMCCQCSAWLWDLVFSTLEVAASHVAHLMSWRQLHSDQTRKRQTE